MFVAGDLRSKRLRQVVTAAADGANAAASVEDYLERWKTDMYELTIICGSLLYMPFWVVRRGCLAAIKTGSFVNRGF